MRFWNVTKTWCQINENISLSRSSLVFITFYLYFTILQRKKPKRRIEREKDEEAGGGDMAWKKQSSRTLLQFKSHTQVEIKKKNICRYAQYIHVTNSYANI